MQHRRRICGNWLPWREIGEVSESNVSEKWLGAKEGANRGTMTIHMWKAVWKFKPQSQNRQSTLFPSNILTREKTKRSNLYVKNRLIKDRRMLSTESHVIGKILYKSEKHSISSRRESQIDKERCTTREITFRWNRKRGLRTRAP